MILLFNVHALACAVTDTPCGHLLLQLNEACGTTQSETMWTSGTNTNRVIMSKGLDNRVSYLYSSAARGHASHLHGKFVNVFAHIYEPVRNAKASNAQVSPCAAARARACQGRPSMR